MSGPETAPRTVPLLYVIAAGDLFSDESDWLLKIRQVVQAARSFPAASVALQVRPALLTSRDKTPDGDPLQRVRELLASIDPSQEIPVYFNVRAGWPREHQGQPLRLHLPEGQLMRRAFPAKTILWAASVHNHATLRQAQQGGAVFVVYGPVWEPQWKAATAVGLQALANAVATTRLPLLALGGITAARVVACRKAGAAGVAVASGIMRSDDVAQALQNYMEPLLSV